MELTMTLSTLQLNYHLNTILGVQGNGEPGVHATLQVLQCSWRRTFAKISQSISRAFSWLKVSTRLALSHLRIY